MGRKILVLGVMVMILLISFNTASAADAFYRLTHNDNDALVIGEVVEVSENHIRLEVVKQIKSSRDINVSAPKKQIPVEGTIGVKGIGKYMYFEGSEAKPAVGDYVIVSINKKISGYVNAWGIYKVDSLDYKNLNVLYSDGASKYIKMDTVALTVFINSDGEKYTFSFDGSKGIVYSDGEIIYEANSSDDESSNIVKDGEVTNAITKIEEARGKNNKVLIGTVGTVLSGLVIGSLALFRKNSKS